jgi:hypothetical protein
MYCGHFTWARPYRLKQHLEKRHPDVNTKAAMEEAMMMRVVGKQEPQDLTNIEASSSTTVPMY